MGASQFHAAFEQAAAWVEQADALLVAAGAGMGVDSGLPDFRGNEGFWKAYPALGRGRIDFFRIASPEAFRRTPQRAWGFYGHRLALYRRTVPHAGFQTLRRWIARAPLGGAVFTSNVDGQFQKAGFAPEWIDECHGSIHHLQCLAPCHPGIWPADDFLPEVDEEECLLRNAPPRCPRCGGLARPNILMFGDGEWLEARERAQARRLDGWLSQVSRPVVIELGAGTAVPSVRLFSHQVLQMQEGRLIRINPREPQVPGRGSVSLPLGALEGLNGMAAALGEKTVGRRPNVP